MVQVAKNEKSKAELYREERKARIAAAAKRNAKKSRKHPNAGKTIGKIVGIVLIVAVVCGIGWLIVDNTGLIPNMQTAMVVGDNKVSVTEYGYMYYMQYQNTVQQAQQSEQQYGYNMYNFDYTKDPAEQDSNNTDEDGNALTWADQIKNNTVTYFKEFYTMYSLAIKDGYKVNEEEQQNIDEDIENMRQNALGDSSSGNSISRSLNAYLKLQYGKGVTEKFLRTMMEKQAIVQRYSEDKQQSFKDKYTDEELDKEYKKDTTEYDAVDLRIYNFEPETLTAKEGESEDALAKRQEAENADALKKAEALLEKVTNEETFKDAAAPHIQEKKSEEEASTVTEETDDAAETEEDAKTAEEEFKTEVDKTTKAYGLKKSDVTNISEDAAKWVFAAKAGDKKAFATDNGTAYALYVVKAAYPQEGVDVRHILFMTVDSQSGDKLTEDEIAEKKTQSESVLNEWKSGDKTEDAFAALANEYSEDTGSNTSGGLYEQVTPGQMVDSFDQWIFDENRKEGDVDIIESEYGYHIMYYVGNRDYVYRASLRTTHTQDDYSSWLEQAEKDAGITENAKGEAAGYKRADSLIQLTVKYLKAQSSASN